MKRIYRFSKDLWDWDDESDGLIVTRLGGKGASLVRMSTLGMPVPPGFTITTDTCNAYRKLHDQDTKAAFIDELLTEVMDIMGWLVNQFDHVPLLSVRSGAPVSMPGMMDTILNVGLGPWSIIDWVHRIGERAAWDSYRRGIQMLGSTAFGVPNSVFEEELLEIKAHAKATSDSELGVEHLGALVVLYQQKFQAVTQHEYPNSLEEQLTAAIRAVFDSWMNPRAVEYRKINGISEDLGTAVTVQAMVFGNMGEDSGTGVLFSRDPMTGEPSMMGEFLTNAQGEDVVAGIRTPVNVSTMSELGPVWHSIYHDLVVVCDRLEIDYRDMVDVEFTVQQGTLYILQSRVGKRSARAAFKIAYDQAIEEGLIDWAIAKSRLSVDQYKIVLRPGVDPKFHVKHHGSGMPACPGVATGKVVFTAKDAVNCTEPCILVTEETNPDDIAGMHKAVGILTRTGGVTCHAAVVARAMNKPCITGCADLVHTISGFALVGKVLQGQKLTIDGSTGHIWVNTDVPVVDASSSSELEYFRERCLSELNAVRQEIFEREDGSMHKIMVAEWWGDENVLGVVLDGIRALPEENRKKIILDARAPNVFRHINDQPLIQAFGSGASPLESLFKMPLVEQLQQLAGSLSGVTLVGMDPSFNWEMLGFKVLKSPTTVADLMGSPCNEPSPKFIMEVMGGNDAWNELKKLFLAAGKKMSIVGGGLPADYAVMKVLGGQHGTEL